jgi:hypothetical protein
MIAAKCDHLGLLGCALGLQRLLTADDHMVSDCGCSIRLSLNVDTDG